LNLQFSPLLKQILDAIQLGQEAGNPVYLVGGAVRDLLLSKEPHDFDFVMAGDVRPAARMVADRLGGNFFMLDEERNTARILFSPREKNRVVIDFASLRGGDIEADLRKRDFTINAMALDIARLDQVLDPLGGAVDLKDKVIRICSPQAFEEDPARLLRAIRMAVEMEMILPPETKTALQWASGRLQNVTPERQRDELFRMLDGNRPQVSLRLMDTFNLLQTVLPELGAMKGVRQSPPHVLDVWEHTLASVEEMNRILPFLTATSGSEAGNLAIGSAMMILGRFRTQLEHHFQQQINANRSRRALLNLALLYHDAGKPLSSKVDPAGQIHFYGHERLSAEAIMQRGRRLALSIDEIHYLEVVVGAHMRIHLLAGSGSGEISNRAVYRFFRTTGEAGVDTAVAALADTLATWRSGLDQEIWLRELNICRVLLEAWWEQKETVIMPALLINGHEIQDHFNLRPGPWIGQMLEAMRESQVMGELETREEALHFLTGWIEKQPWRLEDGKLS